MRELLIAAMALTAISATPALAHPAEPTAAPTTVTDTPTHEMCKAVMGRKMEPRQVHDHARDKSGMVTWPNGKPLTKSEMEKMHKRCAEKMAKADPAR